MNNQTIDLATNPGAVVQSAQNQWFKRPADHKFPSLEKLHAAVASRRHRSYEHRVNLSDLSWTVDEGRPALVAKQGKRIERLNPTHYSFGQACSLAGAPASFFRERLQDRPDLVVQALNHCTGKRDKDALKTLAVEPPQGGMLRLQALTSETYGRIWDADVVGAAMRIVDANPSFHAPLDWGREKRALFASDRDVFMFFIDGGSIVEGGGDRDNLNRGFFMWNSEVGSRTMGIATFLFRQVCGNFGVWGAQDVRVLKIRHTSGGPERFITEAIPALKHYTQLSVAPIETAIRKAKQLELPSAPDEFTAWFVKRGIDRNEVRRAVEMADAEEGQHHTLWDMYNGLTALARTKAHVDSKVDLETRAGKLMDALVEA
jgi:hypothetical protein